MNHPITAGEWIDYCDGTLAEEARRRVEVHLHECAECRETAQRLFQVDARLTAAGAASRACLTPDAEAARAALAAFAVQADHTVLMTARLERAQWLLSTLCGPMVARRVLHVAAERTAAGCPERIGVETWPQFMGHVTRMMSSICGQPAAAVLSRTMAL